MLTILLSLLSSGGFGSLLGLAGGILNRKIDIAAKKAEYDFEIKKLEVQKEYLELEYKTKTDVAEIETAGAIEVAGMNAMAQSYEFAKTTSEDGWVDSASKVVRPFLTLAFFFLTIYIYYQVSILIGGISAALKPDDIFEVYKNILEWIFFQAGVSIGWWFANRSSGPVKFSK